MVDNEISKQDDSNETTPSQAVLFNDACTIIEHAQTAAYRNVNEILINWPEFFHAASGISMKDDADMPTQEELRREIEQQKEFFRLQNKK